MNIRIGLNRSPYGIGVLSGVLAAVRDKPDCMLWLSNPNLPQGVPAGVDGVIAVARAEATPESVPVVNTNSDPVGGVPGKCLRTTMPSAGWRPVPSDCLTCGGSG